MITTANHQHSFHLETEQPKAVLSHRLQKSFDDIRRLYMEAITSSVGRLANEHQMKRLKDKLDQLDLAALYVVVGEVNSGKSSFINALLGEEVCPTDCAPCTAGIQELVYGSKRSQTQLGMKHERIELPCETLRGITVVDTPGTNSTDRTHEQVTEGYMPQCDVVIFVLPAMNPHTGTAWDFLHRIHQDYRHRVVFVMQQADLPKPEALAKNVEAVRTNARKAGIVDPKIFPVSALRESVQSENSGYAEFRRYLMRAVEEGDVWIYKFDGAYKTLQSVIKEISDELELKRQCLTKDLRFIDDIKVIVEERKKHIQGAKRLVLDGLLSTYDRLTGKLARDFRSGMDVGTVCRRSIPLLRDVSINDWLHQLESEFKEDASRRINEDAERCSTHLQEATVDMLNEIEGKLASHCLDQDVFKSSVTADRNAIINDLSRELHSRSLVESMNKNIPGDIKMEGNLYGGGALMAIGGAIALLTKIAIFDITGGILAGLGAFFIGLTLLLKRGSMINEMERKIESSRSFFESSLSAGMDKIYDSLFHQIEHTLAVAQARLEKSYDDLDPDTEEVDAIRDRLSALKIHQS